MDQTNDTHLKSVGYILMQPDALKSTLTSMDPENVIFVNTFSKIFNPGVCIGWVTFPKEIDTAVFQPISKWS